MYFIGDRSPQFSASYAYFGFSRGIPWKKKFIMKNGKILLAVDVNINFRHTPSWMTKINK